MPLRLAQGQVVELSAGDADIGNVDLINRGYAAVSVSANGLVVAPLANANIAEIAAVDLGAGEYEVRVWVVYTPDPDTAGNMHLAVGGTPVHGIAIAAVGNVWTPEQVFSRVTVGAGEAIAVRATANAGAGTDFFALVVATRLTP